MEPKNEKIKRFDGVYAVKIFLGACLVVGSVLGALTFGFFAVFLPKEEYPAVIGKILPTVCWATVPFSFVLGISAGLSKPGIDAKKRRREQRKLR